MHSPLTFTLSNNAVSKRRDDFDYKNKNIRRITVTAHQDGVVAGTLIGYMLDIGKAYQEDCTQLVEVEDLFLIEGEINSLCSLMYGTTARELGVRYKNRQRIFSSRFRKIIAPMGYSKPTRMDLMCNKTDFSKTVLYVSRVCVTPEFRGVGIGSQLIKELGALQSKIDYIALMSFPYESEYETPNSDRYLQEQIKLDRFYKRLGFIQGENSRWMVQTPSRLLESYVSLVA